MMKFTCVQSDCQDNVQAKIEYTLEIDHDISEVVQSFRQFLLAVGYHPDTVENYIEAN